MKNHQSIKSSQKFPRAGYRIHFDRLKNINAKIDSGVMRTHKFKCAIPKEAEAKADLKGKFEDVAKVADSSEPGSLLWFLVQCYGLGFLFVSSEKKKEILLSRFENTKCPTIEDFRSQLKKSNFKHKDHIKDDLALFQFITSPIQKLSEKIRDGCLSKNMIENLRNIFDPSADKIKKDEKLDIWLLNKPILKELNDDICKLIDEFISKENLNSGNKKTKNKSKSKTYNDDSEEQIEDEENDKFLPLLQKYFGINIQFPDTEKTTFVIQEIALDELNKNIENPIDIYKAYFRYLSPAAQKSGYKIQSLAGTAENQNALSNFFGRTLKAFQESEENCRRLIGYANPDLFTRKTEILDFLSKTIHKLANEVAKFSIDFIAQNWGDYRGKVGGSLQGWLSNFENRLNLFEEVLAEEEPESKDKKNQKEKPKKKYAKKQNSKLHKKIFAEIESGCDWENIFPDRIKDIFIRLKNNRAKLFNALQAMQGEAVNNNNQSEDFGKMLDVYNQDLQDFREFLMRWNNEGIPKKIGDEEIIVCKSKEAKPDKLWINENLFIKPKVAKGKNIDDENDEEKEDNQNREIIGKWQNALVPAELDKYPRFIGVAKKDPKKQIEEASEKLPKIILSSLKLAKEIKERNSKEPQFDDKKWLKSSGKKNSDLGFLHKNIDSLRRLACLCENNKNLASNQSFQFIKQFVDLSKSQSEGQEKQQNIWQEVIKDIEDKDEKNKQHKLSKIKFYVSGYEQRKKEFLAVKEIDFDEYLEEFEQHFEINKLAFENSKNITNEKGEIIKIYLALLLRNLEDKEIELPQFCDDFAVLEELSFFDLLYKNNLPQKPKTESVRRFFASGVGSQIRSYISILARDEFIERNVIQITNGGQSMLQYIPLDWGNFDHLKEQEKIKGKRKKLTKRRLAKIKQNAKKEFSDQAKKILQDAKIDYQKSNQEIGWEIWQHKNSETQKKLVRVLAEMPHRWNAILKTKESIPALQSAKIEKGLFFEKSDNNNIFNFCTKKSDNLYSFPIETSVYQKQFLEKFLWGDKDQILTEKISGMTLITEELQQVKWINNKPEIEGKNFEMYVAIPFALSKEAGDKDGIIFDKNQKRTLENTNLEIKNSQGEAQKQYRCEENILGIDLGEYGFGWAIFNPQTKKFTESGFISIPLLSKMREGAKSWKDTQSRGIFSRPTTYLADIREQAAGQIRNQIHHLAIKHKAIPVYEDSVDGFESGGNRIQKLYKTLKTADFGNFGNDAEKQQVKHFWGAIKSGNKTIPISSRIGDVIHSSMTSQTCRANSCGVCKVSEIRKKKDDATLNLRIQKNELEKKKSEDEKQIEEIDLKKISAQIKEISKPFEDEEYKVGNAQRRGFYELKGLEILDTNNKIVCQLKSKTKIDGGELVDGFYSKRNLCEKIANYEDKKKISALLERGSTARFVCQECGNETDADEQAAQNIALKYYLKLFVNLPENEDDKNGDKNPQYQNKNKEGNNSGFSPLKYFLEKSQEFTTN